MGYRINPETGKQIRGAACASPETRRRAGSAGGRVTAERGSYHVNTTEQGKINGRKGGLANKHRWAEKRERS